MQNNAIGDWIPPVNEEAERGVIGSVLLDNDALDIASSILTADAFIPQNAKIFKAMQELREDGEPIDLITLSSKLQSSGILQTVGGVGYLTSVASSVPTAANVTYYAKEVQTCYLKKVAYEVSFELMQSAMKGIEPAEFALQLDHVAAMMVDQTTTTEDFKAMQEVIAETYEQLEERATSLDTNGITGIPSGFKDLDRMTAGFQRSDLIIVAARPSVGKTAFALNIAQHAGKKAKANVAVFSLEMSAIQLGQRAISAEGNIDSARIRTGRLEHDDWDRLTMSIGTLSESSIYIDDTPDIAISDIRAKCRRLKKKLGRLDLIIVDYLQLITLRGKRRENRTQEVSEISRILKQIARELDVPVIALSQLSRAVEQRQDKRPMLSDLRESGAIEQDADIVAFLYRDDYYDQESEKKNIIEVIIAKHRNGPVGTVELVFLKNHSKFVNLDRGHHEQTNRVNKPIPDMYRKH